MFIFVFKSVYSVSNKFKFSGQNMIIRQATCSIKWSKTFELKQVSLVSENNILIY